MKIGFDFDFLSHVPAGPTTSEPPVNVFQILREGHLETRVDMTLRFLLDPLERHGFGTMILNSFLHLLDGVPLSEPTALATRRSWRLWPPTHTNGK